MIVVFARAPVAGQVKTRLIPALGADGAAALYRAFLEDVCATVAATGTARALAVAGEIDHPAIVEIAERHGLPRWPQVGEDLGERMDRAIRDGLTRAKAVCIVGSDAPTLPVELLRDALLAFQESEVVLGPATDGGYWLIGARRPVPELFADMRWGTSAVLPETLRRLTERGVSTRLLPLFSDVDDPGDLVRLRAELDGLPIDVAPATRAALVAPSVRTQLR